MAPTHARGGRKGNAAFLDFGPVCGRPPPPLRQPCKPRTCGGFRGLPRRGSSRPARLERGSYMPKSSRKVRTPVMSPIQHAAASKNSKTMKGHKLDGAPLPNMRSKPDKMVYYFGK